MLDIIAQLRCFCASAGAILIASLSLSGQDTLTLRRAVDLALSENPNLRALGYERAIAANEVDPARAGIGPRIAATASTYYGYGDAVISTAGEQPPLEFTDNRHGLNIRPEASWVVYDNGKGQARLDRLAEASALAAHRLRAEEERTVAEVTLTYLRAAQLRRQLALAAENIALTRERLRRIERDARYGGATTLRRLQTEVDLNNDSVAYRGIALDLADAKRELNRLLGRSPDSLANLQRIPPLGPALSEARLFEAVQSSNANLRTARQRLTLLETELDLAERAWGPDVQLYAAGVYQNLTDNTSFLQGQRYLGAEAGVRATLTLFDGGLRKLDAQNARLRVEQGFQELAAVRLEVESRFRRTYASYRNFRELLRYERQNLETYEVNYRKTLEDYRLGQVDGTAVRTAQTNLTAALTGIALREFSVRRAEVELLLLAGGLIQ